MFNSKKTELITPEKALRGRVAKMPVAPRHAIHGTPIALSNPNKSEVGNRRTRNTRREFIMSNSILAFGMSGLAGRLREIRSSWSPNERQLRAEEGRRRRDEFLMLLANFVYEPEIWAVGSLGDDDWSRLDTPRR